MEPGNICAALLFVEWPIRSCLRAKGHLVFKIPNLVRLIEMLLFTLAQKT